MVMLPNFPGGKLALVEPAALLAESRYQDKSYTVSKLSGASPRKLPDMIVTRLRDVDGEEGGQNRAIFAFLMGGCHFVNMVKQNGVRTLLKFSHAVSTIPSWTAKARITRGCYKGA